jgi:hypothetical protein
MLRTSVQQNSIPQKLLPMKTTMQSHPIMLMKATYGLPATRCIIELEINFTRPPARKLHAGNSRAKRR